MGLNFINERKIIIVNDNKMIIENFRQILNYSDELIETDCVEINGKSLHINEMDDFYIEIIGQIETLKFKK